MPINSTIKKRQFTRYIHSSSGRRKMVVMTSSKVTSLRPKSVKMKEVDGVLCSTNGVFVGRDLKLYETYQVHVFLK